MDIETALVGYPKSHATTVYTANGPKQITRRSRVPTLTKSIARFLSGRIATSRDECWQWLRSTNTKGYGQFRCSAGIIKAHRIAFMIEHGSVPDEMDVLHRCDNPKCVNPHHLFLGSHRDNMADMVSKNRHVKGSKHKLAKLSEVDALEIIESDLLPRDLATKFGVSQQLINAIKRGEKWKHVHADALSVASPLD